MNAWLKRMAVVLVLLGVLTVALPLAWTMLKPALPILLLTAVVVAMLVRVLKKPDGW